MSLDFSQIQKTSNHMLLKDTCIILLFLYCFFRHDGEKGSSMILVIQDHWFLSHPANFGPYIYGCTVFKIFIIMVGNLALQRHVSEAIKM